MKWLPASLILFGGLAASPGAEAHHSGAMYEAQKTLSLTGTVVSYDWKNPHAHLTVLVTEPSGKQTSWDLECSTPNILVRKGWSNASFAPGDKVTATMRPMKDGTFSGFLLTITTAKGVVLKDHDY